jgi:cysteine-rich repeat protein
MGQNQQEHSPRHKGSSRPMGLGAPLAFLIIAAALITAPAGAATFTVDILDPPGEGFLEPTAVAAVGGNPGLTIGDQRLNALEHAAGIWGALLTSSVDIEIAALFAPGACSGGSFAFAAAFANTVHENFAGALQTDTWYPQSLANRLAGVDIEPGVSDIFAQFNRTLDEGCGEGPWYYGYDASPPPGSVDFVTVALHELAHGLGMASLIDPFSGSRHLGRDDVFSAGLEDHDNGLLFASMTDDQRYEALRRPTRLHWVGPQTTTAAAGHVGGIGGDGHVEMFAATGSKAASSGSHFATALSPDENLEAIYDGENHDTGLALDILEEIGWADPTSLCGDGVLDVGEECDDSNREYGDCCSGHCTLETSGSDCAPEGDACRADTCNGVGACVVAFSAAATPCTDADACTINQTCDGAGTCTGVEPLDCDDDQACTSEVCSALAGCVYTPTAEPCSGEFVVNTTRTGSQGTPALAADGDGDFIVVWRDFDLDISRPPLLAAQRFSAEGARVGGEVVVFADDDDSAGLPDVCMDDAGNAVVVWESDGLDSDIDVFARLLPANGDETSVPVIVNTTTDGDQRRPAVSCSGSGEFVVSWDSEDPETIFDQDGSHHGVFFQRFDAAGLRLGDETQVNVTTDGRQWGSAVARRDDGAFLIGWVSGCTETDLSSGCEVDGVSQDGSYAGVYARLFDDDGAALSGEEAINSTTAGQQGLPHLELTVGTADGFAAVFNGAREGVGACGDENPCLELFGRIVNSAGAATGSDFLINTTEDGQQLAPAVATAIDGTILVMWESDSQEPGLVGTDPSTGKAIRDSRGVIARRFDSSGSAIGTEFLVNVAVQGAQNRAVLAAQPDNAWIAAWRSGANETESTQPFNVCTESADDCRDGVVARRFDQAQPVCAATPRATCTTAPVARLQIKAPVGKTAKFKWRWQDAATAAGELDPGDGFVGYAVCFYDASGPAAAPLMEVAPDDLCGPVPCWKSKYSRHGGKFSFKKKGAGGSAQLGLRSSSDPKGRVQAKASGDQLTAPDLNALVAPLQIQMISGSGGCWETVFPSFTTGNEQIKAKTP